MTAADAATSRVLVMASSCAIGTGLRSHPLDDDFAVGAALLEVGEGVRDLVEGEYSVGNDLGLRSWPGRCHDLVTLSEALVLLPVPASVPACLSCRGVIWRSDGVSP